MKKNISFNVWSNTIRVSLIFLYLFFKMKLYYVLYLSLMIFKYLAVIKYSDNRIIVIMFSTTMSYVSNYLAHNYNDNLLYDR